MAKKQKKNKENKQQVLFPKTVKCATCGKDTDKPIKEVYCCDECANYLPF